MTPAGPTGGESGKPKFMKLWVSVLLILLALAGCDGKPEQPTRPLAHVEMSERDRYLAGIFQGERTNAVGKVHVELALNRDSTVRMSTQAVTKNPDEFSTPIVDTGNWMRVGETVNVMIKYSGVNKAFLNLEFSHAANKLTLVTKDKDLFPDGLTLTKVEGLITKVR